MPYSCYMFKDALWLNLFSFRRVRTYVLICTDMYICIFCWIERFLRVFLNPIKAFTVLINVVVCCRKCHVSDHFYHLLIVRYAHSFFPSCLSPISFTLPSSYFLLLPFHLFSFVFLLFIIFSSFLLLLPPISFPLFSTLFILLLSLLF